MAVIDHAFETKGTHLFFVDTTQTDPTVMKLTCPTGITGIGGGSKDKIDTTCLDQTGAYRTFVGGFANATEMSVPFILYDGDASQQSLFGLRNSGDIVSWMVGLSDSTAVPTLDSDENLITPTDRSTLTFKGYVSNLTLDAATNEVVRGSLSIQVTGATTEHWAA